MKKKLLTICIILTLAVGIIIPSAIPVLAEEYTTQQMNYYLYTANELFNDPIQYNDDIVVMEVPMTDSYNVGGYIYSFPNPHIMITKARGGLTGYTVGSDDLINLLSSFGSIQSVRINPSTSEALAMNTQSSQWVYGAWIKYTTKEFVKNDETLVPVNLVNDEGEVTVYEPTPPPPDSANATVRFLLPANDGYTDSTPRFSFQIYYKILVTETTQPEDLTLSVQGGKSGTEIIDSNTCTVTQASDGKWWAEGTLKFSREMNIGTNQMIAEVIYDNDSFYGYRSVNYVTGVVDENDDGIDDRTGQPVYNPPPPIDLDTTPTGITTMIETMTEWLTGASSWISAVGQFLSAIFGFLPVEIKAGLFALFSIITMLTVLKLIRG